jgi:hypothetical protein
VPQVQSGRTGEQPGAARSSIDLGPADDDDPDLLDPHEEITTSAAAVR